MDQRVYEKLDLVWIDVLEDVVVVAWSAGATNF